MSPLPDYPCLRCGHEFVRHTFLLADMARCHEGNCACDGFVYADAPAAEEEAAPAGVIIGQPETLAGIQERSRGMEALQAIVSDERPLPSRRIAKIKFSYSLMNMVLMGDIRRARSSMPRDARIIAVKDGTDLADPVAGWFVILVESETFPEVPDGMPIPDLCVVFHTIEDRQPLTDLLVNPEPVASAKVPMSVKKLRPRIKKFIREKLALLRWAVARGLSLVLRW